MIEQLLRCGIVPAIFTIERLDIYTVFTIQLPMAIFACIAFGNLSIVRILEDTGVDLHLFSQALGSWDQRGEEVSQSLPKWSGKRWVCGSLVRHNHRLFVSTGNYFNVAEPGVTLHNFYYSLFCEPSTIYCYIIGIQSIGIIVKMLFLVYGNLTFLESTVLGACLCGDNLVVLFCLEIMRANVDAFWSTCVPSNAQTQTRG